MKTKDKYLDAKEHERIRQQILDARFTGRPISRLWHDIKWPFVRTRIWWITRDIDRRKIPDFLLFLMARFDTVIAWAIIMYRNTENEGWRELAHWLIDYAEIGTGTNWDKSDLTL